VLCLTADASRSRVGGRSVQPGSAMPQSSPFTRRIELNQDEFFENSPGDASQPERYDPANAEPRLGPVGQARSARISASPLKAPGSSAAPTRLGGAKDLFHPGNP